MSIEYIASIAEAEYKMFMIIMTTELPDDYQTWLRVRERGKLKALTERGASVIEVEVALVEFACLLQEDDAAQFQHPSARSVRPQESNGPSGAGGWFTPTPRSIMSDCKVAEITNAVPLPRARPITPGFYYELVRAQGDGEGDYVLVERQCIPKLKN